jgi:two-component system phosphate regulon sensor histidine kinase PhoR
VSWTFCLLAFVVVLLALHGFALYRDWRAVRGVTRRFAAGDFHPVLHTPATRAFREIFSHLRSIAETQHAKRKQLADEGFTLHGILAGMAEGILIVDPALRIRIANEAVKKIAGLASDPSGRPLSELFLIPELLAAARDCINKNQRNQLEIVLSRRDQSPPGELRVGVQLSPLTGQNRHIVRGAVLVFHDITRLKQLEATRREFVANVSHEFRTPLSIINGYIETLQDGAYKNPEEAKKFLSVMHRHCNRLNLLIEDLLTISQLEHAAAVLEKRLVDLCALTAKVIEGAEEAITASGAQVSTEFDPKLPLVEVDPWRIEQALSNLLINALRYGAKEKQVPRVTIQCKSVTGGVELTVADEGPGIPHEDQPHIFERFYRVHKDRSRNAGGTGLGLSIVRNIVLAHGGEVGVRSKPGEGASFWMRLPLKHSSPSPNSPIS